jgi:hypothetical protein
LPWAIFWAIFWIVRCPFILSKLMLIDPMESSRKGLNAMRRIEAGSGGVVLTFSL